MKHLDDRRRCPHCDRDINERPYLMSRKATTPVLSLRQVAWLLVFVLLLALIVR